MDRGADQPVFAGRLHSTELIARAEADAIVALGKRHETARWIADQAEKTFTVLVAGAGAALAFAIQALVSSKVGPAEAAAGVMAIYLSSLAGVLVKRCMMLKPIPALVNEPKNWLFQPGTSLDDLRRGELYNLQVRLEQTFERNERIAEDLNTVRAAIAATPVLYFLALLAATHLMR